MGAETAGRLPRAALAAALGLVLCVRDGVAQEPISAIDWLTERLRGEAQAPPADPAAEGAPAFGTLPGATPGPGILEIFPEAPSPRAR
ncbi:MAG: hypothetical protein ACO21B_11390, partial [Gemmobacter sp.]